MIIHDQFYTKPHIVQFCLNHLRAHYALEGYQLIEPAAGTGEFLQHMPGAIAIDIDPRAPGIERGDFLTWEPPRCFKPLAFVGNPPFGKNSSLAVKFFNKAADLGSVWTAFIVPRTFRKPSIQRRLHINYHLQSELLLPLDAFYTVDGFRSVPCVFQVWQRRAEPRPFTQKPPSAPWTWCKPEEAQWAIRRVGVAAGKIKQVQGASPNSHFFVCDLPPGFRDRMKKLYEHFWERPNDSAKWDVAGCPSLTKGEIAAAWHNRIIGEEQ